MGFFDFLFGKKEEAPELPAGPATARGEVSAYTFEGTVMEYFDWLLERNFPAYEAQMMVYPRSVDFQAEFDCYPIAFLLYQAGRPTLALLLVPQDRDDTPAIRHTRESCSRMSIPCLVFHNEARNEKSEVISAIRQQLPQSDN